MTEYFSQYLAISPTGRIEYLKFIIELADIAIRNRDNPQIAPETVEKARQAKEQAERQLEEEKGWQRVQRRHGAEPER